MKDRVAAALGDRAVLVVAEQAEAGVTALRMAARGSAMVLLMIEHSVPKLDRAMLLAAIGPLAVECAPTGRIAALDVAEGADPDDVVAAAIFLTGALSTTGQVLRIAPR